MAKLSLWAIVIGTGFIVVTTVTNNKDWLFASIICIGFAWYFMWMELDRWRGTRND